LGSSIRPRSSTVLEFASFFFNGNGIFVKRKSEEKWKDGLKGLTRSICYAKQNNNRRLGEVMDIVKIEIDRELCTGCKTCVDACFVDVFRWDEEGQKPIAAYPEDCVWCYACETACPAQCIEVKPVGTRPIPAPY
jgi:NAD-dependent dihydropyrimidine dehydrogenase PreA subunit